MNMEKLHFKKGHSNHYHKLTLLTSFSLSFDFVLHWFSVFRWFISGCSL